MKMNPTAFVIFGQEIRWYSILILVGSFLAYLLTVREARKFQISKDTIFNLFFWTLILGILGARLYYVVFSWDYFGKNINEIWQIWQGGLAIHGGIILGLITVSIFCKKNGLRIMRILDLIVPGLILAQSIGRWGNFFNSEAYGAATTLEHLRSLSIPEFVIDGMKMNDVYYTPTFFYESIWCFLGFSILLCLRHRRLTKIGQMTGFYLIWYGLGRFFIEASRTDSLILLGFKMAQIVSIVMICIGISIMASSFRKEKYEDLYNNL